VRSHAKAASVPSTPREKAAFPLGVLAAMLACTAALLGIGAPAASAAPEAQPTYSMLTTFGGGTFIGDLEPPQGPLALDSIGNIFVADELFEHVYVFAPDPALGGTFLTELLPAGSYPTEIAVDLTTDDLYVQEAGIGSGTVKRYTADGTVPPSYTVDAGFTVPAGGQIAVDQSTHEVLVADPGAEAVRRYDTTGTLVATIATPGVNPSLLAVATDGSLFVTSGTDVLHLSNTGSVLGVIEDVGQVTALTIDPGTQNLVLNIDEGLSVYSPTGSRLSTVQAGGFRGLAIDGSSGRLYAAPFRVLVGGEPIFVFAPAVAPGVEPPSVSAVTTTGFHVETEVDPGEEGGTVPAESAVRFEYRLVGDDDWTPTPSQEVHAPGTFEAEVSGLLPNLDYEVRVVASNSRASVTTDPTAVSTLTGPPVTDTAAATGVTETSAVLNGNINPLGQLTTYYYEYGETTAYGSRIPVSIEATAGSGRVYKSFSRKITGLSPGTTYHFRLVATNSLGTTEGPDRAFTTVATGGMVARAYEQVTPADKGGVAIIPRIAVQATPDGEGFSYTTKAGTETAPILVRSLAQRGSDDWSGRIDIDLPTDQNVVGLFEYSSLALSADSTHVFAVTNRPLTPGADEDGVNLYQFDANTREYHFVGGGGTAADFLRYAGALEAGTYLGGAPDFSWIVFGSPVPLLPGTPANALYRWSEADGLEVLSVLPNGDTSASARASSTASYHILSTDGTRIYYSAFGGAEEGVFLRVEGGPPIAVSVSHVENDPATPQPATLLGVTRDGRYAFFTSTSKLTADAPGENPESPKLYRYDSSDGSLIYLGASAYGLVQAGRMLSGSFGIGDDGNTFYFNQSPNNTSKEDFSVWHDGSIHSLGIGSLTPGLERASPNGRYFLYEGAAGSIRLYDVVTDEHSCVTCLADGTPVTGQLPEGSELYFNNRFPQAVDDRGTVYFDTAARLVQADVNGTRDVYVYENGGVSLISPGDGPFDAVFADMSEDGRDVFFTTQQKLVGRDNDEAIDVYDARVNGGLPAQSPPPSQECLRDDCKATPNAGPELPFGGSEALSGPGNVKPAKKKVTCGKGKRKVKVKGKVRCVKKHKAGKNKKGGNR
jgi:sugar lactone lactonase YvrE